MADDVDARACMMRSYLYMSNRLIHASINSSHMCMSACHQKS